MPMFRKKPVVIEARQLTEENRGELADWCSALSVTKPGYEKGLFIRTLEGDHYARLGDYIIKGVQGEFYPCKPDIFEQTYDLESAE